ncbi:Serine/threonine-protein kinase atr [Hypsizygus marmoreus]|uniref:non-specific serine/threonine protein kinase n=1 Tax=Hypsizygus marmoreus TaxID=39966 RepID=A0A369JKP7_HYPMA|nr:Serine/threonine-protein kinase atr [Hypsizygus marmoreus]
MAKGSQLSQLKSALTQAGVVGKPQQGKKRKRSGSADKDKEKKAAKLEEIHKKLNPFDVKVTKLKHDVGGRKIKGVMGKPAQSKQAGIEQRKKTLLKEYKEKDRAGGIVDRRFGENDPTMSLEERMLERFTKERQRASRGIAFNLEDEDELTHYGQSLSKLDDFDNVGLGLDDDEEEMGQIDADVVSHTHFGGFDDDEEESDEEPARKKSKAEVMAEVMAKSKEHKLRRQMERDHEDNVRLELDQDFDALRDLIYAPDPSSTGSNSVPLGIRPDAVQPAILNLVAEPEDYDQHVRELAFDKRAKPKDRTKTEEELALEEKETLEKAERRRRKRMLGLEESDSEDEGKSRGKRKRGGDDLDDDFAEDVDGRSGLGTGLPGGTVAGNDEGGSNEEAEDSGSDDVDVDDDEASAEDSDDSDNSESAHGEHEDLFEAPQPGRRKAQSHRPVTKELPFTFPCPSTHEEFLEIVDDVDDKDVSTVVKRIRALYHTSLAPDNKFKLQTLATVLIDHILYITSSPSPRFTLVSSLVPHLIAITHAYPIQSAEYFVQKLSLMHKNLKRGLSRGALDPEAKTWPGLSELSLLRIIGSTWSTSDLNHAVISPTRVLIGAYLGLGRVRSLTDITSGLFLCTLFLQFEALSKRLVPEVVNFLINTILHLAPHQYKAVTSLPGSFPSPDFRSELCRPLALNVKTPSTILPKKANLAALFSADQSPEQAKTDLFALTVDLLGKFADMYKGLDGFIELYEPILDIVEHVETENLAQPLKAQITTLREMLERLLKFSHQERQPLRLQAHKPIPIPTYIPKFEATTSSYLRRQDPDHERNEAAKLRSQYKQEKKGAIRELRKDAKFLAGVEQEKQREKDRVYHDRMKRVFGSIEGNPLSVQTIEASLRSQQPQSLPLLSSNISVDAPFLHAYSMTSQFGRLSTLEAEDPDTLKAFITGLAADFWTGSHPITLEPSKEEAWNGILVELPRFLFFLLPGKTQWDDLSQRLDMVDATLEILKRASLRVARAFDNARQGCHEILVRLLDLCCVFEMWHTRSYCATGTRTPLLMKETTFHVTILVLRAIGDGLTTNATAKLPTCATLRMFVDEYLNLAQEIIFRTVTEIPATITLFKDAYPSSYAHDMQDENKQPALVVEVKSPFQLNSLLVLGLAIITESFCSPLRSNLFLANLLHMIPDATRHVFDFCLSPTCRATTSERVKLLTHVVSNAAPFYCTHSELSQLMRALPYRLLRFCLEVDHSFMAEGTELAPLSVRPVIPSFKVDVISALEMLRAHSRKEPRVLLINYIRSNVASADMDTLAAIKSAVVEFDLGTQCPTLVSEVDKGERENKCARSDDIVDCPVVPWRERVQAVVQDVLLPIEFIWPDNENFSDDQFAQCILHHIVAHIERPLQDFGSASRVLCATKLGELICFFAHCNGSGCSVSHSGIDLDALSPAISISLRLLDGPEEEVTREVRKRTLASLTRAMRHQTRNQRCESLESATRVIYHELSSNERSVRLCAGNALCALIQLRSAMGHDLETIFEQLYPYFDNAKISVKETLIVSIGSMGRTTDPEIAAQVLCFLIPQLGNQNPVIKGSAFMKIDALRQFAGKSIYSLLGQHIDKVAPFLVSRSCSQPGLIHEACRLMGMSTLTFISMTRLATYPKLFGSCELKVLQQIASDLEVSVSALYLQESAQILAHVFQLQGPGQTQRALDFIEKIVNGNLAAGSTITTQQLIRSCTVPLLAELVVEMGYKHKTANIVVALNKVQRALASPPLPGRTMELAELGVFLKPHTLGLISHLSDMLQDMQGKVLLQRKRAILRSMGTLATYVGRAINNVSPQYMSTFQTMVVIPDLSEVTLESWRIFLTALDPHEIGPYIGPTTAAFISSWSTFGSNARDLATQSLNYIIFEAEIELGQYLDDVVDLSILPELNHLSSKLRELRRSWTPKQHLQRILDLSSSDNLAVATLSLGELKRFMLAEQSSFVREIASGDMFDPMVGQIMAVLLSAACRDGVGTESMRLLAFESIGVLGAVDPDRFELSINDPSMVVLSNYTDEGESALFAMHLIRDLLVGVFRSTSDVSYQRHLGFTLQQLLRVCQFTPALIGAGTGSSVSVKARNRWNSLPKHVVETLSSLLDSKYSFKPSAALHLEHPIYPSQSTYREWIQLWTCHLITKASGSKARQIFSSFPPTVRNQDAVVAYHILPHLVLNILVSGQEDDTEAIRVELLTILQDQVKSDSDSAADKKLLSAQAVFMIMDHLNKWVRIIRQKVSTKKAESKRSRENQVDSTMEEQLLRVDSILSSIDQNLVARAALQCKSYARSLMNFERQIVTLQERSPHNSDLPEYYERLHEIYSYLDEPDGMEGVSTLILSPSLEHQIRQHESTGRWTSAQSCWEVRIQESPDNVDCHIGLLRCLRNLGHYDTLRTHVRGVLIRRPEWESALAGFHVESAWMVGAWDDVQNMVERSNALTSPIVMARLLLAMRAEDSERIGESISVARSVLGAPITAAGVRGYRRAYEAVLDLHLTHELEVIHSVLTSLPTESQTRSQQRRRQALAQLTRTLSARFDSTLPTFRTREPILSLRRTAYTLSPVPQHTLIGELGRSWLASAKIARKAGHRQTAYSAMLQARQNKARFSFMESAKLERVMGKPLDAIDELQRSMRLLGMLDDTPDVLDLTIDDDESKIMKAKAQVLRARWMSESERYDVNVIFKIFHSAIELRSEWESGHFHLGRFHDECFKNLPTSEQATRGVKMCLYTVRAFARAIKLGSKYVYQTVPRLLTIWLDMGEDKPTAGLEVFKKLNDVVSKAINSAPVYKWFTAFPQIVSRVGHDNPEVYKHLSRLIVKVMEEYPKQALWLFTSVVKSTKRNREKRGREILDQLRSNPHNATTEIPTLINECLSMTNELLNLCDYHIEDSSKKTMGMRKDFPRLADLGKSPLIIPLQESLTASLPPLSSSESTHQPFPLNAPTFESFFDEIEIMQSLAKPRKITIQGSNGQVYMFLGKPKDDLRKDARLMDFNAIINKFLKANSESRRRQLHIRTYGVVTLNEECGFIQWVPSTVPIRPVLIKSYEARRIKTWSTEMAHAFQKIKEAKTGEDAADLYQQKILPMFPPVFHEWFVETFPEPTAWLAGRITYARTAAVMSMVGFILGLGDRHCENILLDINTGDVVHVDFNCLFEKGKTLETPERVPFRLTQNMIDGLGVTGVEGVFRIACEVTMQLLRDHKDSLMSVLDAFIHDPLVEWEDEKRKLEREAASRRNHTNRGGQPDPKNNITKAPVDLRMLAKHALNPIEKKLKGIYSTSKERQGREISTSNLVQMLILEATDLANLAKMYPGWAAWY